MRHCSQCGADLQPADKFCSQCGARLDLTTPDPPSDSARGVGLTVGAVVGIALLGLVPMLFMTFGSCSGTVSGSLASTGPRGDFTFTPTGCDSMQLFGKYGANVHGDGHNDGGLYVTIDPTTGTIVQLEVPGSCRNADGTDCTVFDVPRAACGTWDVKVETNGVIVNDVRQFRGHAILDCALPDGTTVQGDVTFDGC